MIMQAKKLAAGADGPQAARAVGLRYVSDCRPGIRRLRCGRGFRYVDAMGRTIRDTDELDRIRRLAIPPAWEKVWICPLSNGHLQATGLDAKDRKQYRYHPRWHEFRKQTNFERMIAFGRALPLIRRRAERDLSATGLSREKVVAAVVCLLDRTFIRIGNEVYAEQNNHHGLTTLRDRHVRISGAGLRFRFTGKSGIEREVELSDRRLARIVRCCRELPGYELFQYLDEQGERQTLDSSDVNTWLQELTEGAFTAKDFRTWAGTVLAVEQLVDLEPPSSEREAKRKLAAVVKVVAERLGNTCAVCRKHYIHPDVLEAWTQGMLSIYYDMPGPRAAGVSGNGSAALRKLRPEEKLTLRILEGCRRKRSRSKSA